MLHRGQNKDGKEEQVPYFKRCLKNSRVSLNSRPKLDSPPRIMTREEKMRLRAAKESGSPHNLTPSFVADRKRKQMNGKKLKGSNHSVLKSK